MNTKFNDTVAGIFVIVSLTVITLSVIWLCTGFSLQKYNTYQVYINESVGGLNIDASVEFNGVHVGTVSDISIDSVNPQLVTLLLKIKYGTPVTSGTRATINTKGLTGIAYLSLNDKGNNLKPIQIIHGNKYPVITASPSLLWQLDSGIRKFNNNFTNISDRLMDTLSQDNLKNLKNILDNLEKITQTIAKQNQAIESLLDNSASSIQTIHTAIIPTLNNTIHNLESISNDLVYLTRDVRDNPAILLRGKDKPPLGPGE